MNNKLIFILAVACGILAIIIIAEWGYALHVRERLLSPMSAGAEKNPLSELPTIDLLAQPEESYVDLVERPLFIKGRKPVAGAGNGQPQDGAVAGGQVFDWQLIGVYTSINDKNLQALFAREKVKLPKDNFRKLSAGGLLDGWQLQEIDNDKVILNQDGSAKTLYLRKAKPKQLPGGGNKPQKPPQPQEVVDPESMPESEPIDEEEFIDE